jgi:integrase
MRLRRFVVSIIDPKASGGLTTPRSRRTLALPTFIVTALHAHRIRQNERRLRAGAVWPDFGLVFPSDDGTPWDGTNVTHAFARRVREAGLPPMRFHDLRYGAALLMLAQGITLREIMEQLGHSQISLTANLYTHVAPHMKRRVAAGMDALFATR